MLSYLTLYLVETNFTGLFASLQNVTVKNVNVLM